MKQILILTSINDEKDGERIAKVLVKKRLVACVNILPKMHSFYNWKGKIAIDNEFLLLIKTKDVLFEKVKSTIVKNHPYELPEIVSFEIKDGLERYLDWINQETL